MFFLDDAPPGAHLAVQVVESAEFPVLPLGLFDAGVEEVDPFLPALYFRTVETIGPEGLRNPLPFLGAELGMKLTQQ